jgi:hypothetical protein
MRHQEVKSKLGCYSKPRFLVAEITEPNQRSEELTSFLYASITQLAPHPTQPKEEFPEPELQGVYSSSHIASSKKPWLHFMISVVADPENRLTSMARNARGR